MDQDFELVDVSIKWPFKWTLVGSSGSGKTNFVLNVIKKAYNLFDQKPDRVIIIYKVFQEIYNDFKNYFPTTIYTEDECDFEELTTLNNDKILFICDDLYFSKKLSEISEHFLVKGRHRNTSWIILTQSIFNQPALKNISRNSTHMTLFKNVRLNEPHIFFSQLRPGSSKVLQEIYAEATEKPYGYLDIDLSQTCPDKFRYKTDLFNEIVKVFVIMSGTSFKTMYLVNKSFLDQNQNFKLSIRNKDICQEGMNVTVKPIRQRKPKIGNPNMANGSMGDGGNGSFEINDDDKHGSRAMINEKNGRQHMRDAFDDDNMSGDESDKGKLRSNGTYDDRSRRDHFIKEPHHLTTESTQPTEIIRKEDNQNDINHFAEPNNMYNHPAHIHDSNLKRQNDEYDQHLIRYKHINPTVDTFTETSKKKKRKHPKKRYTLNKHQKRIRKRLFSSNVTPKDQNESEPIYVENSNQIVSDILSDENKNLKGNIPPRQNEQIEEVRKNENVSNKRLRIEDESDDQWMSGLKSRLNERRVQFKRKQDSIGYRVLPSDEAKSIIKPSDFKFLDPVASSELLGQWKSLKELKRKQPKNKRLKPFRSFSVWKEPSN